MSDKTSGILTAILVIVFIIAIIVLVKYLKYKRKVRKNAKYYNDIEDEQKKLREKQK